MHPGLIEDEGRLFVGDQQDEKHEEESTNQLLDTKLPQIHKLRHFLERSSSVAINPSTDNGPYQPTQKLSHPVCHYMLPSFCPLLVLKLYAESDRRIDVGSCEGTDEANDDVDYHNHVDKLVDVDIVRVVLEGRQSANGGHHEHQESCA